MIQPHQRMVINQESVIRWIAQLRDPATRQAAAVELNRIKETIPNMGPLLWNSFGTVAVLLCDMTAFYPRLIAAGPVHPFLTDNLIPVNLRPVPLSVEESQRMCHLLCLLNAITSHPETRHRFVCAEIQRYVYPFLEANPAPDKSSRTQIDCLWMNALSVFMGLLKTDDPAIVRILVEADLIVHTVKITERGSEKTRTYAMTILHRLLMSDFGLAYACETYDRFSCVARVLGKVFYTTVKWSHHRQGPRSPQNAHETKQLRIVIQCYKRLSDDMRGRQALKQCVLNDLYEESLVVKLGGDPTSEMILRELRDILIREVPPSVMNHYVR